MQILKTISQLREFRSKCSGSVGFVPTMGALHAGHAELIKSSVTQNDHTIVSIFVNPTQFLAGEDLNRYPRTPEADIKICELCQVDAVFMPEVDEIYNLFTRNLESHKPLSSDIYEELIESGYYNHNNKRVQFKDEFNSIVYKISEHINEKYKDKEFSEYLLEQSLI